jgi:DDE superfamily endonuclease
LDPGRQALLVLAHLRCGDTYARLAGGFEVSVATVFRYSPSMGWPPTGAPARASRSRSGAGHTSCHATSARSTIIAAIRVLQTIEEQPQRG